MSINTVDSNWLAIQQQVKADVLRFISTAELAYLAKQLPISVQGFSKKNVDNAPRMLLRQAFEKFLNTFPNLQGFFQSFCEHHYEELKDISFEQFALQASLNETITIARKVALFSVLFPDKYMDYRDRIMENIKNEVDPLYGFAEPSLDQVLKAHFQKYDLHFHEWIRSYIVKCRSVEKKELTDEIDLFNLFLKNYEGLEQGIALHILDEFDLNSFELTEQEELLLKQLAFLESLKLSNEQFKRLESQIDGLTKEKNILTEKLNNLEKNYGQLEQELNEQRTIHEKTVHDLNKEIHNYKKELKLANHNNEQTINDYQEKLKSIFAVKEDFVFLTQQKEFFTDYLPNENLVEYKKQSELKQFLDSVSQKKILFIDSKVLKTKQQNQIEFKGQERGLTYKFVDGTFEEVFRKIIFYLEGNVTNETEK